MFLKSGKRHWLDVGAVRGDAWVRNESAAGIGLARDYVIRTFNSDKPYDQFVREQIAGDVYAVEV